MDFNCCFKATEEGDQSIRYSSECLAAHTDRVSKERYRQGAHVLIKCLLCLWYLLLLYWDKRPPHPLGHSEEAIVFVWRTYESSSPCMLRGTAATP
jgi:hypothetical protein